MGRHAQSAWIIRVFAVLLGALPPALALATADALPPGVSLNASANCSNGNLNISLHTQGANWEKWQATNAAGSTFSQGQGLTGLPNFSSPPPAVFVVPFSPSQPPGTLVASYAYVGEQVPDATNTAEFLVLYNCTTLEVLLSCYGPYGTCPQTAQQALAALVPRIPAQGPLALLATIVLVAGAGGRALARRTR